MSNPAEQDPIISSVREYEGLGGAVNLFHVSGETKPYKIIAAFPWLSEGEEKVWMTNNFRIANDLFVFAKSMLTGP